MTSSSLRSDPRRALVFLLYDPDGLCDESTLHTIEGFRQSVELLFVVSNGALDADSRSRLTEIADVVLERENIGYDVGAYRDAFAAIGWDRLGEFDELLMVNYTFFGPVGSFEPVLARMAAEDIDFWGISDHPAVSPHPYLGKGTMPAHLQSFWLALRRPILASPEFRKYWEELDDPVSYEGVVTEFETRFTEHFAQLGYAWKAAYPAADYGVNNPSMEAPLALIEDGCPLFKKRLYFHDAPWLARQGVFSGAVTAEAVKRGFPEELVVSGVCRRASARELSFGMDATFVVPELPHRGTEHPPALSHKALVGRPWKALAHQGLDAVIGDADFVTVEAFPRGPASRRDGDVSAWRYANSSIVEASACLSEKFLEHPKMAALFPYMDLLSDPVAGRQWLLRTRVALKVAQALGLKGPFGRTSVIAPYRGISAYRRELLEAVASRIETAGGWDELAILAGSKKSLERILDLLAGDVAKDQGAFVGQIGTAEELRRSASLLQDAYSRRPFVQPGYLDYPYSGRVDTPGLKNHIGAMVKAASPRLFESLHATEKRGRSLLAQLRGKSK